MQTTKKLITNSICKKCDTNMTSEYVELDPRGPEDNRTYTKWPVCPVCGDEAKRVNWQTYEEWEDYDE